MSSTSTGRHALGWLVCWSLPDVHLASPPVWMYIAGFVLLLGPLVTVHEFGHYLMGRLFGVKADTLREAVRFVVERQT